MKTPPQNMVPWDVLTDEEQLALRERYGYFLDNLPPTCSLESKIARFQDWLEKNGVSYT